MLIFKITLFGLLYFFTLALGSKCPQDIISKIVVCYYKGETSLINFNVCNCTHVVFMQAVQRTENNSITATEDAKKYLETIKEKKENLSTIFTLEAKPNETSKILKSENRSEQLINGIAGFLQESLFDGVELNFNFGSNDGVSKESYATFVKMLSKTLSSVHRRVKRNGYDVIEKLQDDITTVAYTTQTPKNSTSRTQSIKGKSRKPKENNRKIREKKEKDENDADYLTLEEAISADFSEKKADKRNTLRDVEENLFREKEPLIFVRLSVKPEIIAKKFDLKILSKYANILIVPTHNIVNDSEEHLTYHPSRLMGLSDILNTDSILDFLTGLGAQKSKIVITLPASVLKFQLIDENKNTPRSPSTSKPQVIDQSQLCVLFGKNNWTVERDDDLTAPYAFSGKTWLAFEDGISVNIKGKYILLRDLAGGAIYPIDFDRNDDACKNPTGFGGYLTGILHKNFENLERKPRALILESLQEEVHDTSYTSVEGVKLSEYRIVRIVDHSGAVHVIRKNTKTQFECSRQGYFSHPLGCNKFYRCVKFDQYSDEFTVFEYDCPAGLAFDERWEVCVWPGSLPHGAPCTGSSEIAPVPRSHYECPNQEGYYADPENCRWFFACLDHARNGITPLTAYEFRCPFGLVFSEQKLACDWPWLVGSCGNRGTAGYLNTHSAGQSQIIHSATFINGGNLEASLHQYGNTDQENSFTGFGKKFGSVLKETNNYNSQSSYQGAQTAGFGYIANQFDDPNNRASFATFPDYEISGGRIFNKGGVVLDENIAGIFDTPSGGVVGGLGKVNIRGDIAGASKSLNEGAAYYRQTVLPAGGAQSTFNKNFQNLEADLETSKADILGISGGQISLKNSIPTPKPFSVSIPSVQVNSEKNSEYSEHSTVGSTIPQTLIFKEIPSVGNANIQLTDTKFLKEKQYSNSHGFSSSQPIVSVGIPVVTSTTETLIHGGAVSAGYDSSHLKKDIPLNIPTISISSTPRTKTYRFGQSNSKQNRLPSRISVNQVPVTVNAPSATGKQSFKHNTGSLEGKIVNETISTFVPLVTPKPIAPALDYTEVGQSSGSSQSFGSRGNSFVSFSQQKQKIGDQNRAFLDNSRQNIIEQSGISYGAPLVTVAQPISITGGTTEIKSGHLSVVSSEPTTPGFGFSTVDEKVSNELRFNTPQNYYSVPTVTPKSEFFTFPNAASTEHSGHLNGDSQVISNKVPSVTLKSGFQIFSQTGLNLKDVTDKSNIIPSVTPQPNYNRFSFYGNQADIVSVTPVVPLDSSEITSSAKNSFGQSDTAEVSKLSYNVPVAIPQTNVRNFEQISSFQKNKISQEEKPSYSISSTPSGIKTDAVVHTEGVSNIYVQPTSDVKFLNSVPPTRPVFGQRYSYSSSFKQLRNQFGSKQPFETVSSTPEPNIKSEIFVPKIEQSNTLKAITIEPQPVVPVGICCNSGIKPTLSTPKPLSVTQDAFSQSPAVGIFNFKSSYVQPSLITIATPPPAVSTTLSTPIKFENQQSPHFSGINIIPKSPQPIAFKKEEKVNLETLTPVLQQTIVNVPGNIITAQKPFDLKQEIKSSTPSAHVITSIPGSYTKDITSGIDTNSVFHSKSNAYLSSVTSESGFFQENPQFETTEKNQILLQKQPLSTTGQKFVEINPLTERGRTKYIQQVPVQVSTVVSDDQHQVKVSTSKPFPRREEFLGLDISKSVEINPSQFYQPADDHLTVKQVDIQQKPLHLISQKTFPDKPVIQPFYIRQEQQKEKETVHSIANNIPESIYQKQFVLRQKINVEIPKTEILKQKQYLPPAVIPHPQVTKTVSVEQPHIYSEGVTEFVPVLPAFYPSKIPLTEQKETAVFRTKTSDYIPTSGLVKISDKAIFSEPFVSRQQPQEIVSSNVNPLLPTSTEVPQYTLSKTEELSVQTQRNFDSQKLSAPDTPKNQNVFIQPEVHSSSKPIISAFDISKSLFQYNGRQNSTEDGNLTFSPEVKYDINPNIAIPEPPKEYILAQNEHVTTAPALATTLNQFSSKLTESAGHIFKGSTYLPPQISLQKEPTKTTVISVGDLKEKKFRNGNVPQVFDKYSRRFGELINGKNGNIVRKVIKGDGEGEIAINKEGSFTVQHEVSTTKPRQNIRGRQYYGGITSGTAKATNTYEDNINGDKSGQRRFETKKASQDDTGKTTIDLKNVKLDKNKKTVIVVSQVSDANPVLIGKLAGQCSCQSNVLELRSKGKKSKNGIRRKNLQNQLLQSSISNEYLPPYESNQASLALAMHTVVPNTVVINGNKAPKQDVSYTTESSVVSSSTAAYSDLASSTILSSLGPDGVLSITPKAIYAEERTNNKGKQFRGRARYLQPSSVIDPVLLEGGSLASLLSSVPASEIASTFDYSALKESESRNQNEIDKGRRDGISKATAGAAFDRYGPGGWRGFDETLQGSIDCRRPGLFRHPKYCNKFYACNYDPWKERYTLHVFNCPIHLAYDSSISACNWPVKGPACADNNLLV